MGTDTGRAVRGVSALAAGCVLALVTGTGCAVGDGGPGGPAEGGADTGPPPLVRGDVAAVERADLEAVFTDAGIGGTFVLHDARANTVTVVGPEEARERAVPGSTFRIPHTLIGLQTGTVEDVDEVLPGASPRAAGRERATTLRDAFPDESPRAYRELARGIGHDRLAAWVDLLDYGNRSVGGADAMDRFWSEGPLEISAMEQALFLARLARTELPADTGHQRALHEIATVEEGDGHTLYAVAGTGADPAPGWWVGWVEYGEELHAFALRVEPGRDAGTEEGGTGPRAELGRELLVELAALPPEAAAG
ncbi:penicillin-binding transpeptidase domain-containing protein [Nocardiopsis halotolerans]|uniref:penicillin-binding transpeptidase domain-containing protein n=1 Tax=Nocardiopsis halotolerans TaxID=124252 RepID=UPI00034AF104|nr:penicillin-binding transpeptidase domain-containing protein [Nocardiopsis halotolerans]